jgi:formate dehydrogenase subunit gamma
MSATESPILPNGRVLRYSYRERMIHWLAALSYIYLMLTGLAFWTPWLFWIAVALGGGTVSRQLHPWAGLIFTAATLFMYRMWGAQMKKSESDKAFWDAVPHYIRNEDEKVPSADRFNAGQKLLFWGFFWCGVALLVSGLILWFTSSVPWNLRYLRYFAVIVHPVAALLTIGLFIIHVYMGTAMERGAFGSVIRGDVSAGWAKRYHRVWYDQLTRSSTAKK